MNERKKVIEFYNVDEIGIINLNDPPLNILRESTKHEWLDVLKTIKNQNSMRVLIIHNTGKYFGAGADINEMKEPDYSVEDLEEIINRITDLSMPTIAALDGSAYGGSFEIALACDIRIARKDIVMAMTEVNYGTFPGVGGTSRLIQLMGRSKAIEVMLMAYKWTAEQWLKYDVVNSIAYETSAFEEAMKWAQEIAKKPFIGPRAVKDAVKSYMKPRYDEFIKEQQRIMYEIAGQEEFMENSKKFLDSKGD